MCIGTRTGRGHFTVAGITVAQSIIGGAVGVEESVTSVNETVGIREVYDNQDGCDTTVMYFFRTPGK